MSKEPAASPFSAGAVIARRYRLIQRLGQGAMGVVWQARDEESGTDVALKLIVRPDPDLRHRLLGEAQACSSIRHENVVTIHDVGETGSGDPFFVMELLSGETLADTLARKRRLEVPEASRIGREIALALAAAHEKGIAHRDLKPANVFLCGPVGSPGARVKVLDFGVSKNAHATSGARTPPGSTLGSPMYMSPEQALAEPDIDGRTDVWSLGIILFEMLSGTRPFEGDALEILQKVVSGRVPLLWHRVRYIHPGLSGLVMSCLRRCRDDRPWPAEDIARRLETFALPPGTRRTVPPPLPRLLPPPLPPPKRPSANALPQFTAGIPASATAPSTTAPSSTPTPRIGPPEMARLESALGLADTVLAEPRAEPVELPAQALRAEPVEMPAQALRAEPVEVQVQALRAEPVEVPAQALRAEPVEVPAPRREAVESAVQTPLSGPVDSVTKIYRPAPLETAAATPRSGPVEIQLPAPRAAIVPPPLREPQEASPPVVATRIAAAQGPSTTSASERPEARPRPSWKLAVARAVAACATLAVIAASGAAIHSARTADERLLTPHAASESPGAAPEPTRDLGSTAPGDLAVPGETTASGDRGADVSASGSGQSATTATPATRSGSVAPSSSSSSSLAPPASGPEAPPARPDSRFRWRKRTHKVPGFLLPPPGGGAGGRRAPGAKP